MRLLILSSLIVCSALTLKGQVKLESGLLLNGGTGSMRTTLNPTPADRVLTYSDFKNKTSFSVGYRFRLLPEKSRFFYDIDLNAGGRLWGYDYDATLIESSSDYPYRSGMHSPSTKALFASLGATVGYRVYKGLSVGAGIEPTYYYYQSHATHDSYGSDGVTVLKTGRNSKEPAFDIPLVGRVSYNFKFMEISLAYKHGLMDVVKNDQIKSGKFSDWQLSLYIPF